MWVQCLRRQYRSYLKGGVKLRETEERIADLNAGFVWFKEAGKTPVARLRIDPSSSSEGSQVSTRHLGRREAEKGGTPRTGPPRTD